MLHHPPKFTAWQLCKCGGAAELNVCAIRNTCKQQGRLDNIADEMQVWQFFVFIPAPVSLVRNGPVRRRPRRNPGGVELEPASFVLGSNCSFRAPLSLAHFCLAHWFYINDLKQKPGRYLVSNANSIWLINNSLIGYIEKPFCVNLLF